MRLSDIVAHSSTSSLFAQIALVVALLGFVEVIVYVLLRRNRATFDRASRMPLDDDQVQPPHTSTGRQQASQNRSS